MTKKLVSVFLRDPWKRWALAILLLAGFAFTAPRWWPILDRWIDRTVMSRRDVVDSHGEDTSEPGGEDEHDHAHEEDEHNHAEHSELSSLTLTPQSLKNLGLTPEYLEPVALSDFYRTIAIPAIVIGKPGRTDIQASSPMDGIVQHVHTVSGEAVTPGDLLFEVRLTYEDLVEAQTQLLKNLSDLEVEQREVTRLEEVTRSGAIASKLLLERQYAVQKLESSIAAQRAALKLHGLDDEQVDTIVRDRRLLRELSIVAPSVDSHDHEEGSLRLSDHGFRPVSHAINGTEVASTGSPKPTPLIVERLAAAKGQGVSAGEMLCVLSDYSSLYIEGKAFEQDVASIIQASAKNWPIEAIISGVSTQEVVPNLAMVYVANEVDPQSRTLSFFVHLPNSIVRDDVTKEGPRFITWKYRIGQRLEVRVPIESWEQQFVLPVEAAVKDGADWFVFQQNGDHFDRIAVHVKYRDQRYVVIENDGAIFAGDVVALRSAHQMQMAVKNKSGGGADPHAGHNH